MKERFNLQLRRIILSVTVCQLIMFTAHESQGKPITRPKITWVKIKGGAFMMGSKDGRRDERPVHRVHVKSFMMSKTEVTVGQYRKCVNAKVCSAPRTTLNWKDCNWAHSGREDHPINCVSWFQLNEFAKWVGARLPTEAEWEYAARSRGKKRAYPWGNQEPTCSYAVMNDRGMNDRGNGCGKGRTWPVCSKTLGNTQQGLCDMGGNVWEWVQDEYEYSYDGAPSDGKARCDASDCSKNPRATRVLRGGGWINPAAVIRLLGVTIRYSANPANRFNVYGGRLARSVR